MTTARSVVYRPSFATVGVLVAAAGATLAFNHDYSPNPVDLRQLGKVAARFAEITRLWTPWFWGGLAAIFALERWRPAIPGQPVLGRALGYDVIWFVAEVLTNSGLLLAYGHLLYVLYENHLAFLRVDAIGDMSVLSRFAIAALLGDFLGWFHHWVRHKLRWLWYFHEIHHSQRELNPFTDLRYHFVEYLVTRAITAVPMFSLGFAAPTFVVWDLSRTWYTRMYHSNVRAGLGPLRWILVTPQSHRIHHSIAPEHRDRNFGVLLCVWDRLFGTHYDGRDEYPATGVDNADFPLERREQGLWIVLMPVEQILYPFRMIWRDVRGAIASR